MKIRTEIFQSTFIITCEGPSLNPGPIEVFLSAMQALIKKNRLDIFFDLSAVKSVEGAQLGTISRALEAIDGYGRLIICGVDERSFKFLKMTQLGEQFLQASCRGEALSALYWKRKEEPSTPPPAAPEPPAAKEAPVKPPVAAGTPPLDEPEKESEEQEAETIYEVDYDDVEIVTHPDFDKEKDKGGAGTQGEARSVEPITEKERRKFYRVKSRQIMDEEFILFCKNTVTGKYYTAVVENIGLGGLFMKLSPPRAATGDELLLEGRIGKLFKFKEKAVFLSRREEGFIFEFVDLSDETSHFLNQLVASLNK